MPKFFFRGGILFPCRMGDSWERVLSLSATSPNLESRSGPGSADFNAAPKIEVFLSTAQFFPPRSDRWVTPKLGWCDEKRCPCLTNFNLIVLLKECTDFHHIWKLVPKTRLLLCFKFGAILLTMARVVLHRHNYTHVIALSLAIQNL